MKKLLFSVITLSIACAGYGQGITEKLDTLVNAYAKLHKFNGAVLVAKGDSILLHKGYGYRHAADKTPNDAQTVFQLGSLTKQFTAVLILKLQEEHKLHTTDKLSKYFPGYPKADSISIRQLLSHTSGIYDYTRSAGQMADQVTRPSGREKMMALFRDKPLDFPPGTQWHYSNSGYYLLGCIIEDLSSTSYEQAMRRKLFAPMQLSHSGFDFTHLQTVEKATGYFTLDKQEASLAPIVDSSVSFAAGAIYSTTGDLYRWHRALQQHSILPEALQEEAYTPVRNKYGYGWFIDSIDGKRRLAHGGGIPGFASHITRVPQDNTCIILLSNASDAGLQDLSNSIFAILYHKAYALPKEKPVVKLSGEVLAQYTGEYQIPPGLPVTITIKEGELLASMAGQPPAILQLEKEDRFSVRSLPMQIEFTRNEKKEVDGFLLYQGGGKIACKKIK